MSAGDVQTAKRRSLLLHDPPKKETNKSAKENLYVLCGNPRNRVGPGE